jgi:hypothetical protein
MRAVEGVEPEQLCCCECKMSYQQFVDNGKPGCPGRPHTNADLWPDIRVKYHPDDIDWMHWDRHVAPEDGGSWPRPPAPHVVRAARHRILSMPLE